MYIELLWLLNLFFDFIILFTINIVLGNNKTIKDLFIGSLFGSLFTFLVFIKINNYLLILIKLISGLLINLVTFGYRGVLKNTIYLYMVSTILAGFIYYLNLELSSYLLILIISPLYLYIIFFQYRRDKRLKHFIYPICIYINEEKIVCNGLLDTGFLAYDYEQKKKIILIEASLIKNNLTNNYHYLYLNGFCKSKLIKVYEVKKIIVNKKTINNYEVGIVPTKFHIGGIRALLPNYIMEEI